MAHLKFDSSLQLQDARFFLLCHELEGYEQRGELSAEAVRHDIPAEGINAVFSIDDKTV